MNENLVDRIEQLIIDSLCECKKIGIENESPSNKKALFFPVYSNGEKRFSEQEPKILLINELFENNIYLSIETPTEQSYGTGRSENCDLCINEIENGRLKRISNIEYKASNSTGNDFYLTDFEKLLMEKGNNYFVHVLDSANNGTLFSNKENLNRKPVINKYIETFRLVQEKKSEFHSDSITLFICLLKPFLLIKKHISCDMYQKLNELDLSISHEIKEDKITILNASWEICLTTASS